MHEVTEENQDGKIFWEVGREYETSPRFRKHKHRESCVNL